MVSSSLILFPNKRIVVVGVTGCGKSMLAEKLAQELSLDFIELDAHIVWSRAEALVWLDYPFLLVLGRLWNRTWRRWWMKELLWGTNYEQLLPQFRLWSKESLFNWLIQTYRRRKRQYPQLLSLPEYSHLKIFYFKKPEETQEWLDGIARAGP
jgi:hypothetical protein